MWLAFASAMVILHHRGLSFFDANEFATHIQGSGIPHAPGYPFYILVCKFFYWFTADPFAAQFAVNLTASLVAVVALHLTLTHDGSKEAWRASLITCAAFLSGYHFKLYTVLPEVFMLNIALFALLIWCLTSWWTSRRDGPLIFAALVCALGVCHQHTLALLAPGMLAAFLLRCRQPKSGQAVAGMLAGFGIGLLPLLWLVIASHPPAPYTYYHLHGPGDLLFVLLREGYGTLRLSAMAHPSIALERFFLTLTAMVINLNFIGAILLIGLGVVLWRSPPLRGALFPAPPWLWLALSALLLFFVGFLPLAGMPLTTAAYRQIFVRFITIPSFLLLYVAAWLIRGISAHPRAKMWLILALVAILAGNIHRWHNIDFSNDDLIDKHIAESFATATRLMEPTKGPPVASGYMPCIFFVRSDSLYFAVRYYNQFVATSRCYLFTDVLLSGVFRSRAEEALATETLGFDYVASLGGHIEAFDRKIVQQTILKLHERGFRIFFPYIADGAESAAAGLKLVPVGNLVELVDSDKVQPLGEVVAEDHRYLAMIENYLDKLERHHPSPLILDESVSNGVFSNLNSYFKLLDDQNEQLSALREQHKRIELRFEKIMGYKIPL